MLPGNTGPSRTMWCVLPECGAYAPAAMAHNLGNTGLAVTTDFRNFRRLGRLTSPVLDDRDVILFPEKVGRPVRYDAPPETVCG